MPKDIRLGYDGMKSYSANPRLKLGTARFNELILVSTCGQNYTSASTATKGAARGGG